MLLVYSKLLIVVVLLLVEWELCQSACRVTVSQPPWPMSYVLVPQNSTTIINCAYKGITQPYFEVDIANTTFADIEFSDEREQRNILSSYDLYEISNSPSAVIEINNTNVNNGTVIRCTYIGKLMPEEIKLRVYEPIAIVLDIVDVDSSVLNISWTGLSTVTMNLVQNSTLTITYGSNRKVINTTKHHYSFTAPEGAPPCESYNFSVTATYVGATYTGSDCSVPSSVISRILPSLPDIEQLNASLTYSVIKIAGQIKLNVSFESDMFCEDYPVNYTLEVQGLASKVIQHSSKPHVIQSIAIGNLLENRKYFFRVLIANIVGNVPSTYTYFYTTDVQEIVAIYDKNNDIIIVQCDLISGSNAKGCMVVLVGRSGNITLNLTNEVHSELVKNVTCPPMKDVIEIFGFDIESDGSIGKLAISGRILFNNSIICSPANESSKGTTTVTMLLFITVPTILIVLSIIAILMFAILLFRKRSKAGICTDKNSAESKEQTESEESQQAIGLYDLPNKTSGTDYRVKSTVDDVTSKNNCVEETINNTYADVTDSKEVQHIYHVLENNKKVIPPDPDAPEVPPPFKPEPSPPPIYQDILDLPRNKAHTTAQNEYYTVS